MKFRFSEESHTYYLDDKEIPSVTQVLPYNYDSENTLPMERGTAVHKMCYLNNTGKSDVEIMTNLSLSSWFQNDNFTGYLDANKRFRDEHDLSGLYDYKTGSPVIQTAWQLAGYQLLRIDGRIEAEYSDPAYEMMGYHPNYKFAGTIDILASGLGLTAVYLKDNGKYNLVNHAKDLRKNTQIFLAFLLTYKAKKENNLL